MPDVAIYDAGVWSLHVIESQPNGGIHPHSAAFLIIVGWVWPIYFLVRSAVGAFIGGLVKDIPFKLPAVGLLWVLYHNLIQQARRNVGAGLSGCTDYVAIQMQYLSAFILGYLFIATTLREFAVRENLYVWLRRRAWWKWALALDGLAAVGLAAISAPWFLEGAKGTVAAASVPSCFPISRRVGPIVDLAQDWVRVRSPLRRGQIVY